MDIKDDTKNKMNFQKGHNIILGLIMLGVSVACFSSWFSKEDLIIKLFASLIGIITFFISVTFFIPIFTLSDKDHRELHFK